MAFYHSEPKLSHTCAAAALTPITQPSQSAESLVSVVVKLDPPKGSRTIENGTFGMILGAIDKRVG